MMNVSSFSHNSCVRSAWGHMRGIRNFVVTRKVFIFDGVFIFALVLDGYNAFAFPNSVPTTTMTWSAVVRGRIFIISPSNILYIYMIIIIIIIRKVVFSFRKKNFSVFFLKNRNFLSVKYFMTGRRSKSCLRELKILKNLRDPNIPQSSAIIILY